MKIGAPHTTKARNTVAIVLQTVEERGHTQFPINIYIFASIDVIYQLVFNFKLEWGPAGSRTDFLSFE